MFLFVECRCLRLLVWLALRAHMRVLWQYREQKVQRMEATAYILMDLPCSLVGEKLVEESGFRRVKFYITFEPARDYNIKKTQIV